MTVGAEANQFHSRLTAAVEGLGRDAGRGVGWGRRRSPAITL